MHRGADDRDTLLGKLPSLPPVHMLLDPAERIARRSVQVLHPGLVLDHAWLKDTVVPPNTNGAGVPGYGESPRCPLALEPIPTASKSVANN
ncbi:hypothetical protein Acr_00g0054940 [Actinidia rufa]|uniref:Uncharacterized protein n=1 Tax=Actinidia rufa TaxID=165716 RepID=A0A7J0DLS7_9ERIC|nr:hypothetical protein Acr_00g0054940 [Actinidia rufa]